MLINSCSECKVLKIKLFYYLIRRKYPGKYLNLEGIAEFRIIIFVACEQQK